MAYNEGHGRFPRISDCLFPTLRAWREMMIKDVMVRLDGTAADEVRLTVANDIADHFQSHVIGLFLNVLPVVIAAEDGIGATRVAELLQKAREAGDTMEARLTQRLALLQKPWSCAGSIY
jgi:hypothetical protein